MARDEEGFAHLPPADGEEAAAPEAPGEGHPDAHGGDEDLFAGSGDNDPSAAVKAVSSAASSTDRPSSARVISAGGGGMDTMEVEGGEKGRGSARPRWRCRALPKVGNNYVLLERRGVLVLSVGPHYPGVAVTFILLSVGVIIMEKVWLHAFSQPFQVVCFVIYGACVVFLFATAFSDPGIVRQSAVATDELEPEQSLPYCDICEIYQPPSTCHCDDCGVCVRGLDHHCPWMGKCIGVGNMQAFRGFITSLFIFLGYFFFVAVAGRVVHDQ